MLSLNPVDIFSQIVNDNNVQAISWSLKSYNARKRNNSILFVPNYIEFNSDLMLGKLVSLPTEDNNLVTHES